MIDMQTELNYLIGDFPACFRDTPLAIPIVENTKNYNITNKEI